MLPEGDEPRTLKAADRLLADGVADIILIGPAEKIKEMTEMYKQVLDKWCAKYIQEMQVGTPSYYNVCKIIDDIHHDYSEACRYLVAMDSDKRRDPKYAMKQYQNFCDSVQELEREVQEYLNEIK